MVKSTYLKQEFNFYLGFKFNRKHVQCSYTIDSEVDISNISNIFPHWVFLRIV